MFTQSANILAPNQMPMANAKSPKSRYKTPTLPIGAMNLNTGFETNRNAQVLNIASFAMFSVNG